MRGLSAMAPRQPVRIIAMAMAMAMATATATATRMAMAMVMGMLLPAGSVGAADGQPGAAVPHFATSSAGRDAFSQPLPQLPPAWRENFQRGRALFRQNWVIAPSQDSQADGLGPFYNRISCVACHAGNGKGNPPDGPAERASGLLVRLSVPGVDSHGGPLPHPAYGEQFNEGGIPGVPGQGRLSVRWRHHALRMADGTRVDLRAPLLTFHELGYGALGPSVLTSPRVGPAIFGLGLLEAVPPAALQRYAQAIKPDRVTGRVNLIHDGEGMAAGRFGLKANRATLRGQVAGAMLGDLGITSSPMPHQACTAAQTACLQAISGGEPELSDQQLDDLQLYLSFLAPPAPRHVRQPRVQQGGRIFERIGCAVCHRPQLALGSHPLLGHLDGGTIAPYSDLLLHDMGPGLADGRPDYLAGGRDWRTAPLWGAGLLRLINERSGYLHDGRARDLREAILWHGGEGAAAQRRYVRLSARERDALLAFINSL